MKKKVFVGISGGVDSSVAAALLLEQGYEVTGVFMKNWSGEDYGLQDLCPWEEDLEMAQKVCKSLGIELKVYNFEREYRKLVLDDFFKQYELGNTPNPDILCNKAIKFDKFLQRALSEGADYIATGHYAKTENGHLYRAKDSDKDQTYFLHQLTKEQLGKSLFPLGGLTKSEVREIAKDLNMPNAKRKDSQGICFIGQIDLVDFLKHELKQKEGNVIDEDNGEIVGKHIGVWFYTVGQRRGVGIGGSSQPYFVSGKNVKENLLFVVKGKSNPKLWQKNIELENLHLIDPQFSPTNDIEGIIRHRGESVPISKIQYVENAVKLAFDRELWAPAAGQSVAVYDKKNGMCYGGGVIKGR